MSDAPIGIFDSGVGGLTVARAVMDMMPAESVVYVGDTAHGPYGPLTRDEVTKHSLDIMNTLAERGVKMIVIACNTASSALSAEQKAAFARDHGIPVIEVIEPAVRRAAALTHSGDIGVIGTAGTIASGAYNTALEVTGAVRVTSQACPRFVELVEAGVTSGPEVIDVAEHYLAPLKAAGVDTVILGCTHYPMLAGAIGYVMGEGVTLVDSASETAMDVFRTLAMAGIERTDGALPSHQFLATGETERFESLAQRFLGPVVGGVERMRP